jgi:hypothetical protein
MQSQFQKRARKNAITGFIDKIGGSRQNAARFG